MKSDIEKKLHPPHYILRRVWIAVFLAWLIVGCTPTTTAVVDDPVPESETTEGFSLQGNPNFSESQLSNDVRLWYRRMWAAIEQSSADIARRAESGDARYYSKDLNMYNTALITALRATGDLRLLDEVDRTLQIARSKLADAWLDGSKDGYLNWLYLYTPGQSHSGYGKDTRGALDETMIHAHIAAMAYAFHVNRDLESPSGVPYGERADFWLEYLKNHFERKWRERNEVPSGYPFLRAHTNHAYTQWLRYYHYMYKLTGDRGYRDELVRMGKVIATDYLDKSTPIGTAFVFDHVITTDPLNTSTFSNKENAKGLQPTTYIGYSVSAALDLHLERVAPFNVTFMRKFARTLVHYVLDGDSKTVAIDIGGGINVRANNGKMLQSRAVQDRGFKRPSYSTYVDWPLAALAAYDITNSNKIRTKSLQIYQNEEHGRLTNPKGVHIPAAMVFVLSVK